ncbi:hypothetical protein O7602_05930 [Micromonospora sp. WMMD1128]|uniref:hypothetical protein n=1 Tax=Micromonospora sp. WMMD1128 TaxID=3015150 RepID=UPI00248C07A3|nr:hypothetical protein [Micromonospora sp. WMMD1128]WBB75066.1 hypothetical protein O7602_05930 [Micromonospora sp. WMMD1128]
MGGQRAAWYRLTRKQRGVVVAAMGLALVGLVLALTVNPALGAMVIAVAALVIIFTQIVAPPD